MTKKNELLEIAEKYLGGTLDSVQNLDTESMTRLLQHISGLANLDVRFDYVTTGIDESIFSSVFVKNLYEGRGYNIILDVSFKHWYHTLDELIDTIIAEDERARAMIKHFEHQGNLKTVIKSGVFDIDRDFEDEADYMIALNKQTEDDDRDRLRESISDDYKEI